MSYIAVLVLMHVLAALACVLIVLPPFIGDYFGGRNGVLLAATFEFVFGWAAFKQWRGRLISGFDAVDNARIRSLVSRLALSILAAATAAAWCELPLLVIVLCVLALVAVIFVLQRRDVP